MNNQWFNTSEVLDLVLGGPPDANDSDDEFEGYVEDNEMVQMMAQKDSGVSGVEDAIIGDVEADIEMQDDRIDNDELDKEDENEANEDTCNEEEEIDTIPEFDSSSSHSCTEDMSGETPSKFFKLLVTDELISHIVTETNTYADQYFEENSPARRSRLQQWKKKCFEPCEFLQFVAILIIMGLIHYPKLDEYWSTRWPFCTSTFSRIMSRDRFSCLLKFFHVNNNANMPKKGDPGYDPLYKIRPMINLLIQNFKAKYNLGRELSIDESMVSFKGRLWFIQYMPKKPTKWGMKGFVLADAKNGYTYDWLLYTGEFIT